MSEERGPGLIVGRYGSTFIWTRGRSWRIDPTGRVYRVLRGRNVRMPRWVARRCGVIVP